MFKWTEIREGEFCGAVEREWTLNRGNWAKCHQTISKTKDTMLMELILLKRILLQTPSKHPGVLPRLNHIFIYRYDLSERRCIFPWGLKQFSIFSLNMRTTRIVCKWKYIYGISKSNWKAKRPKPRDHSSKAKRINHSVYKAQGCLSMLNILKNKFLSK